MSPFCDGVCAADHRTEAAVPTLADRGALECSPMSILAIDAGTTGVTALLVSTDLRIVARGYSEFPQHFPADGWVEHDPARSGRPRWPHCASCWPPPRPTADPPTAVGITNQRETICFWDRETLGSPRRAIVWQDRRTAGMCASMREAGHEPLVERLTGLRLDPYFSATKLAWVRTEDRRRGGGSRPARSPSAPSTPTSWPA